MPEMTATEAVTFGRSTESQRAAWNRRHWADDSEIGRAAMRTAGGSGSVADAYAWGWHASAGAHGASAEYLEKVYRLALGFGEEYAHARWLYLTERTFFCNGYANAWDYALRTIED